jgi:hypothetical protein
MQVNLALTALAEVQFNDNHLALLRKNNVIGLCLNVLSDKLSSIDQNKSRVIETAFLVKHYLILY